jgi:hypothetical protein
MNILPLPPYSLLSSARQNCQYWNSLSLRKTPFYYIKLRIKVPGYRAQCSSPVISFTVISNIISPPSLLAQVMRNQLHLNALQIINLSLTLSCLEFSCNWQLLSCSTIRTGSSEAFLTLREFSQSDYFGRGG